MIQQTIQIFTEEEEKFLYLLIEVGIRKNIAKALVYLAKTPEASSREIERGTDMRQPDVSTAIKHMYNKGWIKNRKVAPSKKGRPIVNYSLAVPVKQIMTSIEKQKKEESNHKLELIRKMKNYI